MSKKRSIREVSGKNEEEEETKKKMKTLDISDLGEEETKAVKEFVETLKKKKTKKKVGFSSINTEKHVKDVFGKKSEELPFWKINFTVNMGNLEKTAGILQESYKEMLSIWLGKKEETDRVYIIEVIKAAVRVIKEKEKKKFQIFPEEIVEGKDAAGPIDYVIKLDGVVLVIVEAKKTGEFEKGVPQLLMQLKAVQEEEGLKNKWYYGFAATKELWTPCRLNMKLEKDKVQIGERMVIDKREKGSFIRLLYVMTEILQGNIK